jgi:hypothetical protein
LKLQEYLIMAPHSWTDCEGFHRRDFLKFGAAGLFGLSLPKLLELEARAADAGRKKRANAVILVWLSGGPSTIDMWDLKPDAPEEYRGEFKPIPTRAPGVDISEHLPQMAEVADQITVVRSLAHSIPDHGLGTVYMTTGNKPTPALKYPALGSLTTRLLPADPGIPPYITFGTLRSGVAGHGGYLGAAYNPFVIEPSKVTPGGFKVRSISLPGSFTLEQLENRDKLLKAFDNTFRALDQSSDLAQGIDRFHQKALDILRSDKTRKAFDLTLEKVPLRQRYGMDPFGQGALAARRLVEAGVRFVTVGLAGWDTHFTNFQQLSRQLLPRVDQTLSALIADLKDRGMLDRTIVYCAGEFGRTPRINKGAGRDHWARSMAVVLAGGGFRGGYVHGSTDSQGMAPALEPCSPDDVSATIFHCLGVDPGHELMTPSGRPVQLFREGKVVSKLLS